MTSKSTIFQDLNNDFDYAISTTALFKKIAFHVHSPDSHDWGRRSSADPTLNDELQFKSPGGETRFLDHLSEVLDIACITDHMKAGYACRLAAAASKRPDIAIFPGMEINCKFIDTGAERIHLLVIFPPDASLELIGRIFSSHPQFPDDANRTGQEDFEPKVSLADWCEETQRNAIVVLAHIDEKPRGHRAQFRSLRHGALQTFCDTGSGTPARQGISEQYKTNIIQLGPDAIEIMNPEDLAHYVSLDDGSGEAVDLPCVVRSDFHCIEDISDASRHTYVKVSGPTFEHVRNALRFPATRIRFGPDLPAVPSARVIGIRITSRSGVGLFDEVTVPLNPNLNCLIGARGCGKSTFIEALRYVMGLNELLSTGTADHGGRTFKDIAKGIQHANLIDTRIEVVYQDGSGQRTALFATFDPQEDFTTKAFDLDGSQIELASDGLRQRCPIRIYSWSEIETLGREHDLQRDLLDRLIPQLDTRKKKRNNLRIELTQSRDALMKIARILNALRTRNGGTLGRYSEFKAAFAKINTVGLAKRFERLDLARQQRDVLEHVLNELEELHFYFTDHDEPTAESLFGSHAEQTSAPLEDWWDNVFLPEFDLPDLSGELQKANKIASDAIKKRIAIVTKFHELAIKQISTEEAAIRDEIGADTAQSIKVDQREQSKARLDQAERLRNEYLALFERWKTAMKHRLDTIQSLVDAQLAVSGARNSYRDDLTDKLSEFNQLKITIDLRGGRDRKQVVEFLDARGFLKREVFGNFRQKEFAERCALMATPPTLASAILNNEAKILLTEGADWGGGNLSAQEGGLFVSTFYPYAHDEGADVETVDIDKIEKILKLQEQVWDDTLAILLDGSPVDELSPGQRSSAMLPLIALAESVPLVIDQPEDNLDNRLVGTTLTRILARLKEHRQIIVATHSPNIVVGGDAEQVLVLESEDGNTSELQYSGSIDNADIVSAVISIMEGGREAFKLRERRYGF